MKKTRFFAIVLVLLVCICAITACKITTNEVVDDEKKIREPEYLSLFENGEYVYELIRPTRARNDVIDLAVKLRNAFEEKIGVKPELSTDFVMPDESVPEDAKEILIGDTTREETEIVKRSLSGEMYAVAVVNDKIVICASTGDFLDDAIDYFIEKYVNLDENGKVLIERTTNEIAVNTGSGWLMARTLGIEIAGLNMENDALEVIAAIDADDYEDMGFTASIVNSGSSGVSSETSAGHFESKGASYTAGGVEYTASNYNKQAIVSAKISINPSGTSKLDIQPYVVKFGDTYYGLSAFACAYNGECRTTASLVVKDGVYQLGSAADLIVFGEYVNSGNRKADALLTTDIDLGSIPWNPIGSAGMSYKGTFDGNGKTISGLYINSENAASAGFFGCIGSSSVIKDLSFKDAYLFANNNENAGIIAGENRGLILNCKVGGTVSTSDNLSNSAATYPEKDTMGGLGGLVGTLNGKYVTSVENCEFSGFIDAKGKNISFVGGIAGRTLATGGKILNSVNSGEVNYISDIALVSDKTNAGVGGIIGSMINGTVAGCVNRGAVNAEGSTAGIVGGVAGNIIGMAQLIDCRNEGRITADFVSDKITKGYVGGIIGTFTGKTITDGLVLRCANSGDVTGSEDIYAGGIIGLNSEVRSYILYSYNVGTVKSTTYSGGIAGGVGSTYTFIMNCYNAGKVTGENAGGIIGYTFQTFRESYTQKYFEDDIYISYKNNNYLSTMTDYAYNGTHRSTVGGADSAEALTESVLENAKTASNFVEAHEYYTSDSSVNGGLPSFEYQKEASKVDAIAPVDLRWVHASNAVNDGSRYYMANRYTEYIEEGVGGNIKITVAQFEAKMDDMSGSSHKIIDENGKKTGECTCTAFGKDHYFTISRWKEILDDVEKNVQSDADWANRGEIRFMGPLVADADQSSGSVAVTVRLINDSTTLHIKFNVTYYKNGRNDGATVHEMAHAQLLDGPCASWIVEGNADFVKYTFYEGSDRDNYTWKESDYHGAYTPHATFMCWLSREFGYECWRSALTFETKLTGEADGGWELAFGASYEELWALFGQAGRYSRDAYFED